ncbi:MAG: hypothetical protein D6698_14400 [Gammaproteobacteria bacterium]|nr:MAG: hypothetical protein D6698_14400 [Gammaproteobacteria bacterium]
MIHLKFSSLSKRVIQDSYFQLYRARLLEQARRMEAEEAASLILRTICTGPQLKYYPLTVEELNWILECNEPVVWTCLKEYFLNSGSLVPSQIVTPVIKLARSNLQAFVEVVSRWKQPVLADRVLLHLLEDPGYVSLPVLKEANLELIPPNLLPCKVDFGTPELVVISTAEQLNEDYVTYLIGHKGFFDLDLPTNDFYHVVRLDHEGPAVWYFLDRFLGLVAKLHRLPVPRVLDNAIQRRFRLHAERIKPLQTLQ